jgi:hypothetical protein
MKRRLRGRLEPKETSYQDISFRGKKQELGLPADFALRCRTFKFAVEEAHREDVYS